MTHAVEAAGDEPYGPSSEAHYADPGYQPDGKKRYPLDTEAHCRSAWAYINMPKNADKYTPEQLQEIKDRIRAAGKKYGIEFADQVHASRDILGVEIARPGTYRLKTGPLHITSRMLDDAARFAAREDAKPGYLKLGHGDQRPVGDGEPVLGRLHNLRVEEDEDGEDVLVGDLKDVPDWLAAAAPTHWPNRSMEGYQRYVHDGQEYGLVVEGLSLLGVEPPGIPTLRPLPVAASADRLEPSGIRIVASFGDIPDPASEAVVPPTEERTGMTPAEIREALGLSADASDDEVWGVVEDAVPRGTPVAASAIPAGMRLVSDSLWQQREETIQGLTSFMNQSKKAERDGVIAQAVKEGKFTPAQKPHFQRLWDSDPEGTRAYINSMTRNSALAVMASGYAAENEGGEDPLYLEIFGGDMRKAG